MTDTRTETDSIGAIEVPADAYWGAQTQRSIENFPFGARERMPIGIVHALAIVKQAAARVNRAHGLDAGEGRRDRGGGGRGRSRASSTTSSRWSSGRPAAAPSRT